MDLQILLTRIENLEREIQSLKGVSTFPLDVQRALLARGFLRLDTALGSGVVYSTSGALGVVTGTTGSGFIASGSGGSPTVAVSFTNGIRTS